MIATAVSVSVCILWAVASAVAAKEFIKLGGVFFVQRPLQLGTPVFTSEAGLGRPCWQTKNRFYILNGPFD